MLVTEIDELYEHKTYTSGLACLLRVCIRWSQKDEQAAGSSRKLCAYACRCWPTTGLM